MRPAPSRGTYWKGIVSATSLDSPPAKQIASGVISKVLPKLDSNHVSLPLSLALSIGWRFIRTAATGDSRTAADQTGISSPSESEYDAIPDRLWRAVVAASGRTANVPVAGFVEVAFKRVLNKIIFSIEEPNEARLREAFSAYLKERGVEGFADDVLTEYLNEFTLSFLRSADKDRSLNGSIAFHRKGVKRRSYSEGEEFRETLRSACADLAGQVSAYLDHSRFFELVSSEPSEKSQRELGKLLQEALLKKLVESGRP